MDVCVWTVQSALFQSANSIASYCTCKGARPTAGLRHSAAKPPTIAQCPGPLAYWLPCLRHHKAPKRPGGQNGPLWEKRHRIGASYAGNFGTAPGKSGTGYSDERAKCRCGSCDVRWKAIPTMATATAISKRLPLSSLASKAIGRATHILHIILHDQVLDPAIQCFWQLRHQRAHLQQKAALLLQNMQKRAHQVSALQISTVKTSSNARSTFCTRSILVQHSATPS
ncbi:hypothetical protein THASP1DRAFT_26191 [Thamnocephalis sphaerospora]|uniref:Uncharacterized protein n=1 Tax=Thamnocephalis sphaerospora TaxID=78915 RepID=A0A4P9XHV2_9FUNG|nr:hypothetical protein THASP1DRAFT_26191 [Thamnocephalis sphaerospora]|eukprot:RKP05284.1 hypothetical protein THASP1DRAFT_26191 [Thamnocephalis sphaerospora]